MMKHLDQPTAVMQAIDIFCGCGGTSKGFEAAGIDVLLGLDNDADAAGTYQANLPNVSFIEKDIEAVSLQDIVEAISLKRNPQLPLVISACAPCQPFSQLKKPSTSVDPRKNLIDYLIPIVRELLPVYVFLENVPGFEKDTEGITPLCTFKTAIEALGYITRSSVVECSDYGVPQRRKRLIFLATRVGTECPWPKKTHGPGTGRPYRTVWNAISDLPPLKAGEKHPRIANHTAAALSALNLERIKATPAEGSRSSWPQELKLKCHNNHNGHSDVYGRLRKNSPAPAITTRCISLSNGRFGHPTQNRAISVREAACLQTFPRSFKFTGKLVSQAKQVGNAVPVRLSTCIGKALIRHWRDHDSGNV